MNNWNPQSMLPMSTPYDPNGQRSNLNAMVQQAMEQYQEPAPQIDQNALIQAAQQRAQGLMGAAPQAPQAPTTLERLGAIGGDVFNGLGRIAQGVHPNTARYHIPEGSQAKMQQDEYEQKQRAHEMQMQARQQTVAGMVPGLANMDIQAQMGPWKQRHDDAQQIITAAVRDLVTQGHAGEGKNLADSVEFYGNIFVNDPLASPNENEVAQHLQERGLDPNLADEVLNAGRGWARSQQAKNTMLSNQGALTGGKANEINAANAISGPFGAQQLAEIKKNQAAFFAQGMEMLKSNPLFGIKQETPEGQQEIAAAIQKLNDESWSKALGGFNVPGGQSQVSQSGGEQIGSDAEMDNLPPPGQTVHEGAQDRMVFKPDDAEHNKAKIVQDVADLKAAITAKDVPTIRRIIKDYHYEKQALQPEDAGLVDLGKQVIKEILDGVRKFKQQGSK